MYIIHVIYEKEKIRMKRIFKNVLHYKSGVAVILLLLVIQAFCDLTLPQFTSEIIDVGIQNKGIEHIVPEKVPEMMYQAALANMNEGEKALWESSYRSIAGGYERTVNDSEELERLDHELLIPIVVTLQSEMQTSREEVEQLLASTGEDILHSMGIAFAVYCNDAMGVDLEAKQMSYLWISAGKMLGLAFIILITSVIVSLLAARIGASIGRNLRSGIFRKTVGFSNTELDHFSTASLITRSTNDIQQVQMASTMLLRMLLYAPIIGLGGVYKVAQTGANMGYIVAIAVLIIFAFVMVLMSIAMPKFKIMQTLIDNLNLISREILTGLSVIRAFGREEQEEKRFDQANRELTRTQLATNRVMTFMMPGMMLIMNGLVVAITWISANRIDAGALQVGEMTAFITYSMQIVMAFLMLTMMSVMIPRAGVAAERIEQVLETEVVIKDNGMKTAQTEGRNQGVVKFEHVSFRYPGAKENVLEDISFESRPGMTTAIIGSTGCGKSTLVNLIPRLYDNTEGSITLDGNNIREYTIEDLRNRIGLVPQKGVLFSGTITSNLKFGDKDATEEQLQDAIEIAQASKFVSEKEDGLESAIAQGGSNVSGGQKQRLAIARAIIKNPKVYIFDDSFSALDMKTDVLLRKALADKVADSTMIIVAQRISTIMNAEQILVLDEGRIVGKGTHAELMNSCEVYREIACSQLSQAELDGKFGKEGMDNE